MMADEERDFLAEISLRLIEHLPDAVIVVDAGGGIVLANRAMEVLSGYLHTQLVGMNVDLLLPDDRRKHHSDYRHSYITRDPRVRQMGAPDTPPLQIHTQGGFTIDVDIMLAPVVTRKGLMAVAVLRRKGAVSTAPD